MPSKRDQITKATRDLIIEEGLQDISMSQIAGRAEVGMGTIYNYFGSKEELIVGLYSEIKAAMSNYILDGYDDTAPVVIRFMHLMTRVIHYGLAHPREFRLAEQLARVPFVREQCTEKNNRFILAANDLYVEAQRQHLLKAIAPKVVELLIAGALYALIEGHATGQIQLDETLIEQTVSACWDAIKR